MIYLITGLPGNGKTLYTIDYVRKFAEKEKRPVYYSGIPDLSESLGWQEFENPDEWHTLPQGSIIVIDECQRTFKPLPRSGNIPPCFSELETHRHHGFDIFLITQHPHLIDTRVRRLCGIHRHIIRAFGTHKAMIHEWSEVHADCEKNRTTSNKTVYFFPRDVFSLYKSAEIHTHKVHMPKIVYYVFICVVVIVLCFWMIFRWYSKETLSQEDQIPVEQSSSVQQVLPSMPSVGWQGGKGLTLEEYINSYIPRIENLPHTAPRYDDVTQPQQAPRITGCVLMHQRCTCYSQQATKVTTTADFCRLVVRDGRMPFYDFLPPLSPVDDTVNRYNSQQVRGSSKIQAVQSP